MKYIDFLKKDFFYINKFLFELYLEKININSLLKYNNLKNFSRIYKNRKDLARIKTILNKINLNHYENFKR